MPIITVTTGKNTTGSTYTKEIGTTGTSKLLAHITVTDDGDGKFFGPTAEGVPEQIGSVAYAAKTVSLQMVRGDSRTEAYKSDYEDSVAFEGTASSGSASSNTKKGGEYTTAAAAEDLLAANSVVARYRVAPGAPQARTMTYTPPGVTIDLCPRTTHRIVPGSVRFVWMGTVYEDFEGVIYRGRTNVAPGTASGTLDYALGVAFMTDYIVGGSGPGDFTLQSLWTQASQWSAASLFFTTDVAPLRAGAGGFVLTVLDLAGTTLTANVNSQGDITGAHMLGRIDFARGGVELQFGDFVLDADLTPADKAEWWYSAADVGAVQADKIWRPWPVDPTTLRYSCVSYIYLPVDVSLMGLDPAALPADGRVAFARPGDTCVVGITHGGVEFTPSLSTYDTGHERLSFVQVIDAATRAEILEGYTADLDAGTVTFTDLTDYPAQIKVVARTEVYRQIAEVRIDGKVRLTQPIGYAFPEGSVFSTALRFGDRFARVSRVYDQASWDGTTWHDGVEPDKGQAVASYDNTNHPVEVSNRGAITERWALRIRSGGTQFDLIGQHLGQIANGSIGADFSPMNVAAGVPYMTIRAAGWGAGWVAGNVLFIDTVGAEAPVDCVRCTQPGSPAGLDDSCWIVQRGDGASEPEHGFA